QQIPLLEQLGAQPAARAMACARDREHVDAVARAQSQPRRRAPCQRRVRQHGDLLQHDVGMRRARRVAAGPGLLLVLVLASTLVICTPAGMAVAAPAGTAVPVRWNTGPAIVLRAWIRPLARRARFGRLHFVAGVRTTVPALFARLLADILPADI